VPAAEADAATTEDSSLMPRLYRSERDLEHWFVHERSNGWVVFPARINGWTAHRQLRTVRGLDLREVPLWLSFNTGLPMPRADLLAHSLSLITSATPAAKALSAGSPRPAPANGRSAGTPATPASRSTGLRCHGCPLLCRRQAQII
jgi:hypothetical protein